MNVQDNTVREPFRAFNKRWIVQINSVRKLKITSNRIRINKNTLLAIEQCSELTQSGNQTELLSDEAIIQNNAVTLSGKVHD